MKTCLGNRCTLWTHKQTNQKNSATTAYLALLLLHSVTRDLLKRLVWAWKQGSAFCQNKQETTENTALVVDLWDCEHGVDWSWPTRNNVWHLYVWIHLMKEQKHHVSCLGDSCMPAQTHTLLLQYLWKQFAVSSKPVWHAKPLAVNSVLSYFYCSRTVFLCL